MGEELEKGLFPISQREASILHDLGWHSGFGWDREFDWWHGDDPSESADSEETQLKLVRHVTVIREAFAVGEQMAKQALGGN